MPRISSAELRAGQPELADSILASEGMPMPHQSRWFQFSLRTLLVLMLMIGAYFAGFATSQKLAEKALRDAQDKAAAELDLSRQMALEAEEQAVRARMAELTARAALAAGQQGTLLSK
jgi:hypothetical protein